MSPSSMHMQTFGACRITMFSTLTAQATQDSFPAPGVVLCTSLTANMLWALGSQFPRQVILQRCRIRRSVLLRFDSLGCSGEL